MNLPALISITPLRTLAGATLLLGLSSLSAVLTAAAGSPPPDRPNILWITCEDSSPTLGCYGDPYAVTPNLDALAAKGVRYTRAFAPTGVCATARSSLIMGTYASTIGTQHMRSLATLPRRGNIKPFPFFLRQAGYYTFNESKTDYNFREPAGVWNGANRSAAAHWRNRAPGQPFFSVVNFGGTHEWHVRDESRIAPPEDPAMRHDPARANLPPYLPDTPKVRHEWARQADLVSLYDREEIPKLLQELEDEGVAENTIVFFFSDHGIGLPRAKQFIFDSGMQVPLIVYFPAKWKHLSPAAPGSSLDRMVNFIDFGPTVLSLAGVEVPEFMQGVPFLGAANGPAHNYIYGIRDRMDERYDMSRTVRDERFKYHRNYHPYLPHFPWLDFMEYLETSREFRRLSAAGELTGGQAYFMADRKDLEELYDLQRDPYELENLASNPAYAGELKRLREEHFSWMKRSRDTSLMPEHMLRDFAAEGSEYTYAQSDQFEVDRCITAVRLIERGAAALPELRRALVDDYAPVRYWAAVALANLGPEARPALSELRGALNDVHPEVSLKAAEAMCYAGESTQALPVLRQHLNSGILYSTLLAANILDRIDEQARPLADDMRYQAAIKRTGTFEPFVKWTLDHALRELDTAR